MKQLTASVVLSALKASAVSFEAGVAEPATSLGDRAVPAELRGWLARLRLLEGVPFSYLVADSALLPPESIRFFYVDRAWTDSLVQGALSVGTVNSGDRTQLERLYPAIRDDIDVEEREVRLPGGEAGQKGPAGTVTGLLLRSAAVSGWPGMHVRAYRRDVVGDEEVVPESHPDRIKVLRLERLAPAVLLALFDGVPQLVHLEEPRQGIQFGVRLTQIEGTTQYQAQVPARNRDTSTTVEPEQLMRVFFRPGAPGVLDLGRTAKEFRQTAATHIGTAIDSAEFALQMLRFPFRQVFGELEDVPMDSVFRPSIGLRLVDLEKRFKTQG